MKRSQFVMQKITQIRAGIPSAHYLENVRIKLTMSRVAVSMFAGYMVTGKVDLSSTFSPEELSKVDLKRSLHHGRIHRDMEVMDRALLCHGAFYNAFQDATRQFLG